MAGEATIQDTKMERQQEENLLAQDIINECRIQLMLKFRFLDLALWRMNLEPNREGMRHPLATDTGKILFDPLRVIAQFNDSFNENVRDYLHLVMHCIFRHPFIKDYKNREAWGLACDILVENAVMDMCGGRFASQDDPERRQALSEMRMLVGELYPNKLYGLLKGLVETPHGQQYRSLSRTVLNEWRTLFERDDHGAWPSNSAESSEDGDPKPGQPEDISSDKRDTDEDTQESMRSNGAVEENGQDGQQNHDSAMPTSAAFEGEADAEEMNDSESSADSKDDSDNSDETPEDASPARNNPVDKELEEERIEREWEEISKQIEMNLETFSKEWGDEAGSLMATLAVANRKKHDYGEFLRRFMVLSEEMVLNPDEFDYVYYTYGIDLYGNMPLVEPLEYKETKRIRDFVVVIDTSESVRGDLVRLFIEHTFEILKQSENYATDVNVHVVQCDTKVQVDMKITDLRDVDAFMENFTVRGFGGTDFRPAFDYVETLRKRGDLADMKGLLYFTDGLGRFPEKMPDYEVAFVFMDEGDADIPPVPPWAIKVLIDEVGINRLDRREKRAKKRRKSA